MTIISKLTFLLLLWASLFFTPWDGQVEINLPKENTNSRTSQSKLVNKKIKNQAPSNVSSILQDRNGSIWIGTPNDGVYRYNGNSFTNFTTTDGLESNRVTSIAEDRRGNIWVGSFSGVSYYDGKTFIDIPLSQLTDDFVTSILEDNSGTLWIGTNKGVLQYDGKAVTRFLDNQIVTNSSELTLRAVQCMMEDKHGNIWFTTKEEGVCRYDGRSIINYTPNDITWFRGLLEDKDGNIWAGGRNSGVFRFDGKNFTNILQNGKFDSYTVSSIIQDKAGNFWLGTGRGMWRYDGKTFKNISKEHGLTHNIWDLVEDKANNIWLRTAEGLSRFDGISFTNFSK